MEITLGPFYTCFFVTCFLAVYLKIITQRPHCLKEPVISVTLVSILITKTSHTPNGTCSLKIQYFS